MYRWEYTVCAAVRNYLLPQTGRNAYWAHLQNSTSFLAAFNLWQILASRIGQNLDQETELTRDAYDDARPRKRHSLRSRIGGVVLLSVATDAAVGRTKQFVINPSTFAIFVASSLRVLG